MSRKNRKNVSPVVVDDSSEIAAFVGPDTVHDVHDEPTAPPAVLDAPADDVPAVSPGPSVSAVLAAADVLAPTDVPDAPAVPNTRPRIPSLRGAPVHALFTFDGGILNVAPNGRDVATDALLFNASVAANLSATTAARSDRGATLTHAARLLAYAYTSGPATLGACPAALLPFIDDSTPTDAAAVPFAETRGAHFDSTRVSDLDYAASAARAAARMMYRAGIRYTPAGSFGTRAALPAALAPIVAALVAALPTPTTP